MRVQQQIQGLLFPGRKFIVRQWFEKLGTD